MVFYFYSRTSTVLQNSARQIETFKSHEGFDPSRFFLLVPKSRDWNLNFERHHWSYRVIYQIFADAAVKEVRESSATVRAHANQISIYSIGKI